MKIAIGIVVTLVAGFAWGYFIAPLFPQPLNFFIAGIGGFIIGLCGMQLALRWARL